MHKLISEVYHYHQRHFIHIDTSPGTSFARNSHQEVIFAGFQTSVQGLNVSERDTLCSPVSPYQALELLDGSLTFTRAGDMWSTGVILAEIALAKCTFHGDSKEQIIRCIVFFR